MSSRARVLATSAAAAALTLPLLMPQAGSAADPSPPAWGPAQALAASSRAESLAVDAHGTVTVVWATGPAPGSPRGSVVAVRRPADGGWSDPVVIGHGSDPQVAADEAGDVTAVWTTGRGGVVVRRLAQDGWLAPVRLSDAVAGHTAADPALAVGPAGDAVVAWASRDGRRLPWQVWAAYRPDGGGWGVPQAVSPAAGGTPHPQVGIGQDGTVVLLVARQRFGHPQVLEALDRTPDGAWTEPALVARDGYSPALAVDLAGNAVVAFTRGFDDARAAYRPAGGDWTRPRRLSPEGADIADYSLAMTGAGDAVLALGRASGRVDVLRRPAGGSWSAPERVVPRGTAVFDVLVAVDGAGDTFLGWGGYGLLGAYQPSGGTWSEPFTISRETQVDVLEATYARMAPNGDVSVLWRQEDRPLKVRSMTSR